MQTIKNKNIMNKELNELEQKIRQAIPELYVALGHGKSIQLNHVLEYLIEEFDITRDNLLQIIGLWDLKYNLLSEQSTLLIKFLNEL